MHKSFYVDTNLVKYGIEQPHTTTDEEINEINKLNRNGPIRELKKDEVIVRKMVVMGEEPTTKQSIHPEGIINNREVRTLSKLVALLPGAPMMVGHQTDKVPWGRVYKASLEKLPGYKGQVVVASYYFMNDEDGQKIARAIDGGIRSEGSISYRFKEALCSICHKAMAAWSFFVIAGKHAGCIHKIGKKDPTTGQIAWWYPNGIASVTELSHVYRGAYRKTKSMLQLQLEPGINPGTAYGEDEIEDAKVLGEMLEEYGIFKEEGANPDDIDRNKGSDETTEKTGEGSDGTTRTNGEESDGTTETNGNKTPNPGKENRTENGNTGGNSKPPENHGTEDAGNRKEMPNQSTGETSGKGNQDKNGTGEIGNAATRTGNSGTGNTTGGPGNTGSGNVTPPKKDGETTGIENEPGTKEGTKNKTAEQPEQRNETSKKIEKVENQGTKEGTENKTAEQSEQKNTPEPLTPDDKATVPETGGKGGVFHFDALKLGVPDEVGKIMDELAGDAELDGDDCEVALRDELIGDLAQYVEVAVNAVREHKSGETGVGDENGRRGGQEGTGATGGVGEHCELCGYSGLAPEGREDGKGACPECAGALSIGLIEELDRGNGEKGLVCGECYGKEGVGDTGTVCTLCGEMAEAETYATMFSPVGAVKPAKSGMVNNEYFEKAGFADLPDGTYDVEGKYDGVWFELHKKGSEVRLYSGEGNEHTEKFPGIVKEAKGLQARNFIIAGEMVKYRGRQRLGHSEVSAYIHSKGTTWDDKDFRLKPFDMPLRGGRDVTGESGDVRRAKMEKLIPWGKQIHVTRYTRVKHKKGEQKIVRAITERATREGSMVKNVENTYDKKGAKLLWKWKRQFVVDCLVAGQEAKEGGGFVYTCEVGNGKDRQVIGKTFPTTIDAKKGEIIGVSVDHVVDKDGKLTWFAPKVVGVRKDKKRPDPVSTLQRIAEKKRPDGKNVETNVILLGEVVPRLKTLEGVNYEMWLVGSIVENGYSTNDVDIATKVALGEEEKAAVLQVLGDRVAGFVDFICDPEGPVGPNLRIEADMTIEQLAAWKFAKRFVIQEHGWGKKRHWDVRFGAPKTPRMWGYTCFSEPTTEAGGKKVRCQEKKYHDAKWMTVDKKEIKPGEDGHPGKETWKGNAYMVIRDKGGYDYVQRKPGVLEVVLHGAKWKGRYLFREIAVKSGTNELYRIGGDEVGAKSEKIWIMWKPKEQAIKGAVNKIAFKWQEGMLTYWESEEIDEELNALPEIGIQEAGA